MSLTNQQQLPGSRTELQTELALLFLEYEKLKDEQLLRVKFRDGLIYGTLGVAAWGGIRDFGIGWLLSMPLLCVILGWMYLVHDEKVSALGRYIREDLAPRAAGLLGGARNPVFGWEAVHRRGPDRIQRKRIQCGVELTTFCVIPLVALGICWLSGRLSALLVICSIVEAAAVLALGSQIVLYARRSR